VALSEGDALELTDCGLPTSAAPLQHDMEAPAEPAPAAPRLEPLPADLQAFLDEKERHILVRALRETGFNRTLAAKQLGLTLRQIRYRIARLKIDAPDVHNEEGDA
jgi:two-component system response regulator PilR (NtrC family)